MIRSMTAFAREETQTPLGKLTWEIRSVNHRFLEVFVRLPDELRAIETTVRERIAGTLSRGKLDCQLRYRPLSAGAGELTVNERLVGQLLTAVDTLSERLPEAQGPDIMDVLRWPGVLEAEEQDLGPLQTEALALLDKAVATLVETREREGTRIAEHLGQRTADMRQQVVRAQEHMPQVLEAVRERLRKRLAEVSETLDAERIEQEMVLLTQRLDVDEELDRLKTHLDEVDRVVKKGGAVGRRLDFLMQELNREANTLGSKSADAVTTAVSVEMKVLIEQMREQIQNVE
jgi:uncharacterized protein (TIGR00255 family)